MTKLPVISARQTIKKLQKLGYEIVRQTGSHVRLKNLQDHNKLPVTVPDHKILGKGLLRKILRDA